MKKVVSLIFSFLGTAYYLLLLWFSFYLYSSSANSGSRELKDLLNEIILDGELDVTLTKAMEFLNYISIYFGVISFLCVIGGIYIITNLFLNKFVGMKKTLILISIFGTVFSVLIGIIGSIGYIIAAIFIPKTSNSKEVE